MSAEAADILRRFIRVVVLLDPGGLRYLWAAARTLDPENLRLLASEVAEQPEQLMHGQQRMTAVEELRDLARSIKRYGGPAAVRRDADPSLVEAFNRIDGKPSKSQVRRRLGRSS